MFGNKPGHAGVRCPAWLKRKVAMRRRGSSNAAVRRHRNRPLELRGAFGWSNAPRMPSRLVRGRKIAETTIIQSAVAQSVHSYCKSKLPVKIESNWNAPMSTVCMGPVVRG